MSNLAGRNPDNRFIRYIRESTILECQIIKHLICENDIKRAQKINISFFSAYGSLFSKIRDMAMNEVEITYNSILKKDSFSIQERDTIFQIVESRNIYNVDIDTAIERIRELSLMINVRKELNYLIEESSQRSAVEVKSNLIEISKRLEEEYQSESVELHNILTPSEFLKKIDKYSERFSSRIRTYIDELDFKLEGGFAPGEVITIAAQPSIGKTAFCLDVFSKNREYLLNTDKICLFFSLDMNAIAIYYRLIAREFKISYREAVDMSIHNKEAREYIETMPIYLCSQMRVENMVETIKQYRSKLGLVIIDYIQLVQSHNLMNNTHQLIGYVISVLKKTIEESMSPLILISQLNRSYASRGSTTNINSFSDLGGSSSIEQASDIIIFLNRNAENEREIVINIAKNRNGQTGLVVATYDRQYYSFYNKQSSFSNEY